VKHVTSLDAPRAQCQLAISIMQGCGAPNLRLMLASGSAALILGWSLVSFHKFTEPGSDRLMRSAASIEKIAKDMDDLRQRIEVLAERQSVGVLQQQQEKQHQQQELLQQQIDNLGKQISVEHSKMPQQMVSELHALKGPTWDLSTWKDVVQQAESAYWFQSVERNDTKWKRINTAFRKYSPNWPCLWGEVLMGVGKGDGNKWMCGAHLIRRPCIVYSFGSRRNTRFERGIHALQKDCEVHIYDPTVEAPGEVQQFGFHWHSVGLGSLDGNTTKGMPVKTLATLMRENRHVYIDVLKVDIEGAEFESFKQIVQDGWPSIGQLMIEVHLLARGDRTDPELDTLIAAFEKAGFRLYHQELNTLHMKCCMEYAFIQRDWRPEMKMYNMSSANTIL